jgi:L-alanine-DL-glutamate epimerase-like enolase superfamily enzyme
MSRITAITTHCLLDPLDKPYSDGVHFIAARKALVLEVETEDGFVGTGEAGTYGGPSSVVEALIHEELAPRILGRDSRDIEFLWNLMMNRSHQRGDEGMLPAAVSGIDVALWDILGQRAGLPVYRLLGGFRKQIQAYASAGFYGEGKTARDLADEALGYKARGFRHMKMKVGRTHDTPLNMLSTMDRPEFAALSLAQDLQRVRAVREAVGPDFGVAVDANNAWAATTALQAGRVFDELGVAWFEEPVGTQYRDASAELAAQLDTPIAGYETQTGLAGYRELIMKRAVDIVQPEVTWTGGFTACRRIAALALSQGMLVQPHVYSTAVSIAANAHFIASIPNGWLLEFDQNPNRLRTELLTRAPELDAQAVFTVSDEPGLGIRLDHESLKRLAPKPRKSEWRAPA